MKKYWSFFRLRFAMGLQYRAAALAGIITQFMWGFMELMIYTAFYRTDASAFPMTMQSTASYIWLQQSFLFLFMTWRMENEIFDAIINGNVAYELCRPTDIYDMWFARSVANRLSGVCLRCLPILLLAVFLPAPYGLSVPAGAGAAIGFILSMILAILVTISICMLVYIATFFTMSPKGLQVFCVTLIDFASGSVIPLPFFPDGLRQVMEVLPFGSMQNVPFRVYSGDIAGGELVRAIGVQFIWVVVLILLGKFLCRVALRRVQLQGG
ncbi:MAG: ABC-2 family transporter protein [Lachnospiraceae bacterium]|nr:ABC-2 family transporter protein [Lachnospiraceae bacterium]